MMSEYSVSLCRRCWAVTRDIYDPGDAKTVCGKCKQVKPIGG